jgi:hypothetical protein
MEYLDNPYNCPHCGSYHVHEKGECLTTEMTLEEYKVICSATSLPCREPEPKTIAPPRWWIMFTPYGYILSELPDNGFSSEAYVERSRFIYERECFIFLKEWCAKYALIQVIKELMER